MTTARAYQAFGPRGREVAALIARAKRITPDEAVRLSVARSAAIPAVGDADEYRFAARHAAWSATTRYAAARHAAQGAAESAAVRSPAGAIPEDAWDDAVDSALDAAVALVARDLISDEHYQTLAGPWLSVIGGE